LYTKKKISVHSYVAESVIYHSRLQVTPELWVHVTFPVLRIWRWSCIFGKFVDPCGNKPAGSMQRGEEFPSIWELKERSFCRE